MKITHAVGLGGVLKGPDVGIIQKKINQHYRVTPAFKEALNKYAASHSKVKLFKPGRQALKVDNDCGPATLAAIKLFQQTVLQWNNADGRVDPGGATWKALNGNVPDVKHVVKRNGKYVTFSQWDYPNTLIGNSSKYSIRAIGCTLTSLTMAATAIGSPTEHWPDTLLPKQLTPEKANQILKKSRVFPTKGSGNMLIKAGAKALGMVYEEFGRNSNLTEQHLMRLISHLAQGNPVLAHVDYKNKENVADDLGDHWILITRANADGSFAAIDPMFGGEVKLKKTAKDNTRYQGERAKQKTGVLFGHTGGQDTRAGPKTRSNQQKYIVVRFGLLSPAVKPFSITEPPVCFVDEPMSYAESTFIWFVLESDNLLNSVFN